MIGLYCKGLIIGLGILFAAKAVACESDTSIWSTMTETELTFRSNAGVYRSLNVRIAETASQRSAGFQYICPILLRKWGMLFVFDGEQRSRFHMHNVQSDLEIAFISKSGQILEIQQMNAEGKPQLVRTYRPDKLYTYALETTTGRLSELGLVAKDWWLVLEPGEI